MSSPRCLLLGQQPIPYTLRRSRRRTIGLTIDDQGLRVHAPHRAPIADIEAILKQHQAWITRKLQAWAERPVPPPACTPAVQNGMALPWLGKTLMLVIEPSSTGRTQIGWSSQHLTLCLHPRTTPETALRRALMAAAEDFFMGRMAHFAHRAKELGVPLPTPLPPLGLTAARTRWGSCSQRMIRLNWRLMHFDPELVDYVVAHEVSHLLEMNHSPRFWAIVERLYPDWKNARRALRINALNCPRF